MRSEIETKARVLPRGGSEGITIEGGREKKEEKGGGRGGEKEGRKEHLPCILFIAYFASSL
jgi:hypothetical protein